MMHSRHRVIEMGEMIRPGAESSIQRLDIGVRVSDGCDPALPFQFLYESDPTFDLRGEGRHVDPAFETRQFGQFAT